MGNLSILTLKFNFFGQDMRKRVPVIGTLVTNICAKAVTKREGTKIFIAAAKMVSKCLLCQNLLKPTIFFCSS